MPACQRRRSVDAGRLQAARIDDERQIMKQMVSYKLKPDRVDANQRLIAAVFEALHQARPTGLRYASFRQADGVSFVHIVSHDDAEGRNAPTSLPAFKAFVEKIKDRCEIAPAPVELTKIGSYGVVGD